MGVASGSESRTLQRLNLRRQMTHRLAVSALLSAGLVIASIAAHFRWITPATIPGRVVALLYWPHMHVVDWAADLVDG